MVDTAAETRIETMKVVMCHPRIWNQVAAAESRPTRANRHWILNDDGRGGGQRERRHTQAEENVLVNDDLLALVEELVDDEAEEKQVNQLQKVKVGRRSGVGSLVRGWWSGAGGRANRPDPEGVRSRRNVGLLRPSKGAVVGRAAEREGKDQHYRGEQPSVDEGGGQVRWGCTVI